MAENSTVNAIQSKTTAFLLAVTGTGLLAGIMGSLSIVGYCDHITAFPDINASTVALLAGRAGLILAETLFCLAFAVWAGVSMHYAGNIEAMRYTVGAGLALKCLCSAGSIIYAWKSWYYILDPAGAHKSVFGLVIFSGMQLLLWVILFFRLRIPK